MVFGIVGEVGEIGGQRIACPRAFERVHPKDPRESRLWSDLLRHLKKTLASDEIVVVDAGVKISDLQEAGIERYVLRLATNFTARRNYLPKHSGKGRKPVYGQRIRPLERAYKGKTLAKSAPDRIETWSEADCQMRAEIWEDVVLPEAAPAQQAKIFHVYAIYDPAYTTPWLLATPLKLKAATIKAIYQDRWPVEIVFTQMTKTDLFARWVDGDYIADFHIPIIDQHPIYQLSLRFCSKLGPRPDWIRWQNASIEAFHPQFFLHHGGMIFCASNPVASFQFTPPSLILS